MSAANSTLQERASEIRAHALATMALKILGELVDEPSSKRFVRSRASRVERWQQVADCARLEATTLQTLAKAPIAKKRVPRAVSTATNVPITQGEQEQKTA